MKHLLYFSVDPKPNSAAPMPQLSARKNANQMLEAEKVPFVVARRIREAILDEVFKPGDRLTEAELVEKFEVSRSPVREALLALEKEGTIVISPFKGAIVKPLSPEEVLDIAELRLALISLALKPAYRHLSPADFDAGYDLAKRIARSNSARDHFEYHSQFWDSIFRKAQRPILHEVFRQLNDRMTRYDPLYLKVFPAAEMAEREHAERRNAPRGQRRRYPRTKNFYVTEALNALLADHGLSQFCVVEEDEESSPRRVRRFSLGATK